MEIFGFVGILVGLAGFTCAAWFYRELWKWARQCQHARIVVAYKRKTVLQAPIVEWMAWTNLLDKDHASTGRVVYRQGGTSVAIAKAVIPPGTVKQRLAKLTRRKGISDHGQRSREQKNRQAKPKDDKVLGLSVNPRETRTRADGE